MYSSNANTIHHRNGGIFAVSIIAAIVAAVVAASTGALIGAQEIDDEE